jgi:hypothetical protein
VSSSAAVTRRVLVASALLASAPGAGARKRTSKQPNPEVLIHVIPIASEALLSADSAPRFEVRVDIVGSDLRVDPPALFGLTNLLLPIDEGLPTPARIAASLRNAIVPPGNPGRFEIEVA